MVIKQLTSVQCSLLKDQGAIHIKAVDIKQDWQESISFLGEVMPLKTGNVIHNVRPKKNAHHSSFSLSYDALKPHTEAPYLVNPPHYLVLHCVQDAKCGGGLTSFSDGYKLLNTLSTLQLEQLASNDYFFPVMDGLGKTLTKGINKPIITYRNKLSPILRCSENLFRQGQYCIDDTHKTNTNITASPFADIIASFYQKHAIPIQLGLGDLLVLDNYRMLHARTAFTDSNRHLEVLWIK